MADLDLQQLEDELRKDFNTAGFDANGFGMFLRYIDSKILNYLALNEVGKTKVVSTNENLTASADDQIIKVTVVNKTVTLPPLSEAYDSSTGKGCRIIMMKDNDGIGLATLQADGSETITDPDNGAENSKSISIRYESVEVIATNDAWHMV